MSKPIEEILLETEQLYAAESARQQRNRSELTKATDVDFCKFLGELAYWEPNLYHNVYKKQTIAQSYQHEQQRVQLSVFDSAT